MTPASCLRVERQRRWTAAWAARAVLLVAVVTASIRADDPAAEPPGGDVRVEQADGAVLSGRLQSLTAEEVRLLVAGETRVLPVSGVRRILRDAAPPLRAARVAVSCTDGGWLWADDFSRDGERALLAVGDDHIALPFDRVKTVAWGLKPTAALPSPPWLAAVPEKPDSDLVIVNGKEGGHEIVSCAIADVGAEAVTVELDGETIPVKRARVAGLVWLRPPRQPAGGTRVTVSGGSLPAGTVVWSPSELLVDDVRLPAGALVEIDYAAGRTVRLAAIPMERATAEPFFGSLAAVEGMAAFFAPRVVPAPGADAARHLLVIRPRTTAVWRVPADSRRFRTVLRRATGGASSGAVEVTLALDDREVLRRRLDGTADDDTAIDIDVTTARRLAITVDFVPGDPGCAIRFADPAFEK
jgi:hypothetical protein